MRCFFIVILLMMSTYIFLHLYFDWRIDKCIKRHKKQIKEYNELEQQKEKVL
jgi:hypothetical protein